MAGLNSNFFRDVVKDAVGEASRLAFTPLVMSSQFAHE